MAWYNFDGLKVPQVLKSRDRHHTPEIVDSEGKKVKGSISYLEKVNLNGFEQSILVRSKNINNPILVYIHGGPGCSEIGLFRHFNSKIEDYFTVVNWDQRGTCRSYDYEMSKEDLSGAQLLRDLHELVLLLRKRFNKKKVYIAGHSWGSILGILYAQEYPNFVKYYIGISQIVDLPRSEEICHNYLLSTARKLGNKKAIKDLEATNNLHSDIGEEYLIRIDKDRKWVQAFGYSLYGEKNLNKLIKVIIKSPEYTVRDILAYGLGSDFSMKCLWREMFIFNAFNHVKKLDVPVLFIQGRHDYQTPLILTKKYYKKLKAPSKKLIIFDKSSHNPLYEEPEKFNDAIISLLKE